MKTHKYVSILVAVMLFCVLPLTAQPPAATGSGRQAYLTAEELRKQNRCADAIAKYEDAIRAEPNNYKYYFQKGLCEYKQKDIEAAKASFQKTIDLNKEFTSAYAQMARLYKDLKDYENTLYFYEQAAINERTPGRKVQYELILVNLLIKQDKVSEAKRHLEEAQKLAPNNMKVNFYAGEIKAAETDWAAAKDEYLKAIESPDFGALPPAEKAQYYYSLGLAYNKLNDIENAKKAWAKANFGPYQQLINQQLQKSNHLYYYKIAASYYLNNEYENAEVQLRKCLEIQSDFSGAYTLRAKIAKKQNDLRTAIEQYQKAIELEKDPNNKAKMYAIVATWQMDNNDAYGALASIDEALNAVPNNKNLLFMKARAQYGSGRFGDAVTTCENLLAGNPEAKLKAKYAFLLGMAAKKNNDLDKAKTGFTNAMFGPYKPAARIELDKLTGKAEN